MRVIRVGQCCLLALLAISAFAAASASAASPYEVRSLPEAGRCVKVAKGTGFYAGGACVTKALPEKGTWEWVQANATEKLTFSGTGAESTLTTVGRPTIKCVAANISGEYTGPKTASVTIEFQACVNSNGQQCQTLSNPNNKSELKMTGEGKLGFIRNEVREGKKIIAVGMDLQPQTPVTPLLAYECGNPLETSKIEGSVIAKVTPINKMTTVNNLLFFVRKSGEQLPEKFENEPKDTLTTTFQKELEEPVTSATTLSIKEEKGSNASPVEILGKQR
jgi:hypothetical protein